METFGKMITDRRIALGFGLREFCRHTGHNISRWSRLERGLIPAPKDTVVLHKLAEDLAIPPDSEEWNSFIELADISRGEIPRNVLTDEKLVAALPVFFRTVRSGKRPTADELAAILDIVKRDESPDAEW